ncbi:MAG: hypothetical protein HQM10_16560 [Candidatus Riflebacteria bacterium]|nr:hypothetical protein [Candidatus Riflebacteria bacterium]
MKKRTFPIQRKNEKKLSWHAHLKKFFWENFQFFTIIGLILPYGISHYYTYYYEKHALSVIILDNFDSVETNQGVFLIFKNYGNQKEVISRVRFIISPDTGARVFNDASLRPLGIQKDPRLWLQIPPQTGLAIGDNGGVEYSLAIDGFACEPVPGFETVIKEAKISNASISRILALFTPDSKLHIGLEISCLDSKGNLYQKRIFYAGIKGKTIKEKVYTKTMPLIEQIIPGEISLGHKSFAEKSVGTTTSNIEFPKYCK